MLSLTLLLVFIFFLVLFPIVITSLGLYVSRASYMRYFWSLSLSRGVRGWLLLFIYFVIVALP